MSCTCFLFPSTVFRLIFTYRVRSTTEGYVFTGVCLLRGGGGGESPGQVPMGGGGTPRYPLAKVPTPLPTRSWQGEGVPQGTYPPGQGTYPPQPGPDGGRGYPRYLPLARSRWGGYPKVPTPSQAQTGEGVPQGTYPRAKVPTPLPDRTPYGVLDSPRSVCLLRSRRTTFLLFKRFVSNSTVYRLLGFFEVKVLFC